MNKCIGCNKKTPTGYRWCKVCMKRPIKWKMSKIFDKQLERRSKNGG